MNDRQRAAVTAYLQYVLGNVELTEWKFILADDPPADEQAYAMVEPVEGRKLATIRLCADFFTMPVDKIRHVLIHECLHLASPGHHEHRSPRAAPRARPAGVRRVVGAVPLGHGADGRPAGVRVR